MPERAAGQAAPNTSNPTARAAVASSTSCVATTRSWTVIDVADLRAGARETVDATGPIGSAVREPTRIVPARVGCESLFQPLSPAPDARSVDPVRDLDRRSAPDGSDVLGEVVLELGQGHPCHGHVWPWARGEVKVPRGHSGARTRDGTVPAPSRGAPHAGLVTAASARARAPSLPRRSETPCRRGRRGGRNGALRRACDPVSPNRPCRRGSRAARTAPARAPAAVLLDRRAWDGGGDRRCSQCSRAAARCGAFQRRRQRPLPPWPTRHAPWRPSARIPSTHTRGRSRGCGGSATKTRGSRAAHWARSERRAPSLD